MYAARIAAPRTLSFEKTPRPSPRPGEVLVRITGCGVCASNLGPWRGLPWLSYPLAPGEGGHEAWGVIEALGDGVSGLHAGQHVTGLFYRAYAEYDTARAEDVVPLPSALTTAPFPGEPLACAMNIFARADISSGHTVAIVGAGFLGAVLTRLAARAGATVIAVSRRMPALAHAARMGATHLLELRDQRSIPEQVRQLTAGTLCDRVIEATGHQRPLDLAAELTRERGRLIIAGYHQDGPREVNMQLWNWRGLDVVNAHERDPRVYVEGIRRAIDAVMTGAVDVASLLTDELPLARLDAALEATDARPANFLKAWVRP